MPYPIATDLQNFVEACDVVDSTSEEFTLLDFATKIAAAITWWEETTGFVPFLAARDQQNNPVSATRTFDPPRGGRVVLELESGLITPSAMTVLGLPITIGTDCFLRPTTAPAGNKPYTAIRFLTPSSNMQPGSVGVTGVWGYCLDLPKLAWNAILSKGAELCAAQLGLQINGGEISRKEGDEEAHYAQGRDAGPVSSSATEWNQTIQEALTVYTRPLRTLP